MSQQSKTPTFSDDIMPMFYQYAPQMRWRFDLTDYQDVKENADMIYDRISSKDPDNVMPPSPFPPLTNQQIEAFREWKDNGFPK